MNRMEEEVHAHFAEAANQSDGTGVVEPSVSARISGPPHSNDEVPFAKVNSVVPGSPADTAGLRPGDKIIRFGTTDWMNHDKLSKVSEVVMQNEAVNPGAPFSRHDAKTCSDQLW
jgi:26S proteasome regulatory subunit N4